MLSQKTQHELGSLVAALPAREQPSWSSLHSPPVHTAFV